MDRVSRHRLLSVMMAGLLWLSGPTLGFAAGGGENGAGRNTQGALSVFVSILPQAYFAERIGGDRVRVEVLVKPGQDPHTFEPTPQQMARLAEAEAFFRIGVEFENTLMPRIESTMKDLVVVDCREGIRQRQMESHAHDENGGEGGTHTAEQEDEQEGSDPHVWLSVRNSIRIAAAMHRAFLRLDPEGKELYDRGYGQLVEDLQSLDRRITRILSAVKGKPFFVFHPSFGYFADDYGLEQIAVETGGAEPSARQLARLIEQARNLDVRVIFVQPQFSRKSAETIAAEIGGAVIPIDPLARDYIENLEQMARAVEEGLR